MYIMQYKFIFFRKRSGNGQVEGTLCAAAKPYPLLIDKDSKTDKDY